MCATLGVNRHNHYPYDNEMTSLLHSCKIVYTKLFEGNIQANIKCDPLHSNGHN